MTKMFFFILHIKKISLYFFVQFYIFKNFIFYIFIMLKFCTFFFQGEIVFKF